MGFFFLFFLGGRDEEKNKTSQSITIHPTQGNQLTVNMTGVLPNWAVRIEQQVGYFLMNNVLGYFISHAHLDSISGFVLNTLLDIRTM